MSLLTVLVIASAAAILRQVVAVCRSPTDGRCANACAIACLYQHLAARSDAGPGACEVALRGRSRRDDSPEYIRIRYLAGSEQSEIAFVS